MEFIRKFYDYSKHFYSKKIVHLFPKCKSKGNILISYIISPFLLGKDQDFPTSHTNQWECYQIAKTFIDEGFNVDVINWDNNDFLPKKDYLVFIDIHSNLERISPYLNKKCIKILHITGAHWIYQNYKEYNRLLDIQNFKGITLIPRRVVPPSHAIEFADIATTIGNEFAISTFNYSKKEIYRLPLPSSVLFDFSEDKDFKRCRRNYLWLGGSGLVLKGLDIVLEVFKNLPDYQLFVCGPIKNETDFEKAFYNELYETKNIYTYGWVDLKSNTFKEIYENCLGIIYPSASEGCAGSVVNCMHAGLIPIVTKESSVDIGDFGFLINDIAIDNIKNLIRNISSIGVDELKLRSKATWNYAREKYTKDNFSKEYKKFVKNVLNLG